MAKFLVITGDGCDYCDKAKALLTERGEEFTTKDILDAPDEMKRSGRKTVPQIFRMVDGEPSTHIGGFTDLQSYLGLS